MNREEGGFYRKLRRKIHRGLMSGRVPVRLAEYLLVAPDLFHLLCRLATDPDVPAAQKAKIAAAVAYFISPFDLLPEALTGLLGYTDDVALTALVLDGIVHKIGPEILNRHWAGDPDVLELIQRILRVADRMLGSGLWARLKNLGR